SRWLTRWAISISGITAWPIAVSRLSWLIESTSHCSGVTNHSSPRSRRPVRSRAASTSLPVSSMPLRLPVCLSVIGVDEPGEAFGEAGAARAGEAHPLLGVADEAAVGARDLGQLELRRHAEHAAGDLAPLAGGGDVVAAPVGGEGGDAGRAEHRFQLIE